MRSGTYCSLWMVIVVGLCVSLARADESRGAGDGDGFRPRFNGKDLSGWRHVNTAPSTWTWKDDMLICCGKPIGELRTERMYQNFVLELEWRHMVPKGNAGIFVWADDITARGQPFHRSVEVQVLENAYGNTRGYTTHGDIFPLHGATMNPINGRGGDRAFPTENRSRPSPEWNHYRIVCKDGDISLAVNGKVVTRGTECSPRKGYICIESEGGIVHYRNMRSKELPSTPVDARHGAIAERGYRCLYSGVDLSGWKSVGEWKPSDWMLKYGGKTEGKLTSVEAFGDLGFIVDVRWTEGAGKPALLLRGSDAGRIALYAHDEYGASFEKKNWNRLEGKLRGNKLWMTINGKAVLEGKELQGLPPRGSLTFIADAPLDLANMYVREFEKAE